MQEKTIDETQQGNTLVLEHKSENKKKLFIESYGCSMNFSDSEIVASILAEQGYNTTSNLEDADLVLVNTCSIRDKAEQTVRKRLEKYNAVKREQNPKMKVGVLGCMAERLKEQFLDEEKIVDMVVGPDAYKDLPNLLAEVEAGNDAVNVILSKEETYGDIAPVRLNTNGINALVSITRGCDNMCTFCVVPFTRGRERSRDPQSILEEVNDLAAKGYKEVTLLGQNVDSYLWYGGGLKKDFKKATEMQKATATDFAKLLSMVAEAQPTMRVRFSTTNPQDMTEDVFHVMAKYPNICNHIHLPFQSGSDRMLKEMNRQHTAAEYLALVTKMWEILPDCSISQDIIVGFPSATEEDDVPEATKKRRLTEIVDAQRSHSAFRTQQFLGKTTKVLVEKESKKNPNQWSGRNEQSIVVVFPKENYKPGDFVNVKINDCTSATLIGNAVVSSE